MGLFLCGCQIGGALHSLMGLLEKRDPELHSHLVS